MQKTQVPNIGNVGIAKFMREVRSELKKVTWPTRQETFKLTTVVIVLSVIVAVYIGGLDAMFLMITSRTLGR
jgi:preprotein translocase subunit SecE